jgi:hypothetical protein
VRKGEAYLSTLDESYPIIQEDFSGSRKLAGD